MSIHEQINGINEIRTDLNQVYGLLQEIKKETKEQSEENKPNSQIIPTLEVFSKFYTDYLNKQKGESEK